MASSWFGVPQLGQYFSCPEKVGTLDGVNVWVGGALILKNAIASSNHAKSCTNPPGTAANKLVL